MKKILLVEDNPIIAASVEGILKQNGFSEVAVCSSGAEALIHAFAAPPDLIFINVQLAGELDGIQTAEHLRRYFRFPIVFLTGVQRRQIAPNTRLFHPCIILFKPFDAFQLVEIANLVLDA